MKLLYICSHQIHNLTPLFRELSKNASLDLTVVYWQKISSSYHDPEFNKIVNFGIDQFRGYNHYCLFKKEKITYENSFYFKIKVLFALIKYLLSKDYDRIIVHGYTFPNIAALIISKLKGKSTIMRDISYNLGKRNFFFKHLRYFYYRISNMFIESFLPIHKLNEKFYLDFSVDKKKFFFVDHCQGEYDNLIKENPELIISKDEFIRKFNLPNNKKFIFFAGRFIERKNPLMIFNAFIKANLSKEWVLLMAGEGYQKNIIKKEIKSRNIQNVFLLDFQNQISLINFFNYSEILVLPSKLGDTHGNIACEAAQFRCALLLSNMVGLYIECEEQKLGLTFQHNNEKQLIEKLINITSDKNQLENFKDNAFEFGKRKTPAHSAKLIFKFLGIPFDI